MAGDFGGAERLVLALFLQDLLLQLGDLRDLLVNESILLLAVFLQILLFRHKFLVFKAVLNGLILAARSLVFLQLVLQKLVLLLLRGNVVLQLAHLILELLVLLFNLGLGLGLHYNSPLGLHPLYPITNR